MTSSSIAFLFPGQGSQAVGMGGALAASHPAAKQVFEEVNDALGENLFAIMQNGPDDLVRMTRNAQPALFATSMAAVRVLEAELGASLTERGCMAAGHSLGEYAALAAVGSLSITMPRGCFGNVAMRCNLPCRLVRVQWRQCLERMSSDKKHSGRSKIIRPRADCQR